MGKRVTIVILLMVVLSIVLCYAVTGTEGGNNNTPGKVGELPVTLVTYHVDSDTRLPVTGAEFVLLKEDGTYLTADGEGNVLKWSATQEEATALTSDGDGVITLRGILPGIYYLTETNAPNGYHLQTQPVKIQISAQYAPANARTSEISELTVQVNDGEPIVSASREQDLAEITIDHTYGTILPDTGGIGPVIYYMLGMIVLFAVALTVTAKRLVRQET